MAPAVPFTALLATVLTALLPVLAHAANAVGGLTLSPCTLATADKCLSPRNCVYTEDNTTRLDCGPTTTGCFCFPPLPQPCANSKSCQTGEVCARSPPNPSPFCVSALAEAYFPTITIVGDPPNITFPGRTLDPCTANATSCDSPRSCLHFPAGSTTPIPCRAGLACFCFPPIPQTCTKSKTCPNGEICADVPGGDDPICVSKLAEEYIPTITEVKPPPPVHAAQAPAAPNNATPTPAAPTPAAPPTKPVPGVTYDHCLVDSDCETGRSCIFPDGSFDNRVSCSSTKLKDLCFCFPPKPKRCKTSANCVQREICVKTPGLFMAYCVSAVTAGFIPAFIPVAPNEKRPDPPPESAGLSQYPCEKASECKGERTCVYNKKDKLLKCTRAYTCFCYPNEDPLCGSSADCERGEVCAADSEEKDKQFCVAADVEAAIPNLKAVADAPTVTPTTPPATESPDPTATLSASQTATPSASQTATPSASQTAAATGMPEPSASKGPGPTRSPTPCVAPVTPSSTASASVSGGIESPSPSERAPTPTVSAPPATPTAPATTTLAASPSPSAAATGTPSLSLSPTPSETPGSRICVDAKALGHLRQDELVFEEDAWAKVLCDYNGSCATNGHMVTFKGRTMMMKTYCSLAGCEEREMHVNSPKYRRGLRVDSNTEDLQFTAFAARYETRAEEAIMKAAVRVGL